MLHDLALLVLGFSLGHGFAKWRPRPKRTAAPEANTTTDYGEQPHSICGRCGREKSEHATHPVNGWLLCGIEQHPLANVARFEPAKH